MLYETSWTLPEFAEYCSEYSRNLYARRARFEFGPPLGPGAASPASIASAARVSEALWVEHSRGQGGGGRQGHLVARNRMHRMAQRPDPRPQTRRATVHATVVV